MPFVKGEKIMSEIGLEMLTNVRDSWEALQKALGRVQRLHRLCQRTGYLGFLSHF